MGARCRRSARTRAAALSGIATTRIVASTFVTSATLAALDDWVLGAYVGSAFPDMGTPYLLQSVGAVVLGGSLIIGGASTAFGTLCGSMLLILIVTAMQIAAFHPERRITSRGPS